MTVQSLGGRKSVHTPPFLIPPRDNDERQSLISDQKLPPLSAALINSTFIQGFELDDWHSEAPLHSNSILLPALFAAIPTLTKRSSTPVSGSSFLLAYLAGLEVGPRVGNALQGASILTQGWHSGAVFGPSASAASVSKLFGLNAAQTEDALGIACTQACGLMSAQFESEVKRMQHGFAARNGLFAALLAKGGYVGIKKVYEREYGGFLDMFTKGNGQSPQFMIKELTKDMGNDWKTAKVRVKPYAAMAATHGVVDCVRKLQSEYPEEMEDLEGIENVTLTMSEVAFHHGGFDITAPITSVGAQMSSKYVAATQMIDREVMPREFRHDMLERAGIWKLVEKITCVQGDGKGEGAKWKTVAEVQWKDGRRAKVEVMAARGVNPELSNEDIVGKWRGLMRDVIEVERKDAIEKACLGIEELEDVMELGKLLEGAVKNPIT